MRFPLLTSRVLPGWFLAVWTSFTLFFTIVGGVWLVTKLNPAAILYLMVIWLMGSFVINAFRGFRNPAKNFVELGPASMIVSLFRASLPVIPRVWSEPVTLVVPYSGVEGAVESTGRFPHGYLGWPYTINKSHVDVVLKRRRRTPPVWGFAWPWTKVLHLDVADHQAFLAEFRKRIASSGSPPHTP